MRYVLMVLTLFSLMGCQGVEESEYEKIRKVNAVKEPIYRYHDEVQYTIDTPIHRIREKYPWEEGMIRGHHKITKEFFRCKGNSLNAPKATLTKNYEESYHFDCGGLEEHSLPMRGDQEFIYPILIDLLNYLQEKTGCKVVITSGHRCPKHNLYLDPSKGNKLSKHLIGAEVDFFVETMEKDPEKVVKLLIEFYKEQENDFEYKTFHRYEKGDTNVSTKPWYNKEVFIKLHKPFEGRDIDNDHSHPYISIQVRYDRQAKRRASYTWDQAFNGYLRW